MVTAESSWKIIKLPLRCTRKANFPISIPRCPNRNLTYWVKHMSSRKHCKVKPITKRITTHLICRIWLKAVASGMNRGARSRRRTSTSVSSCCHWKSNKSCMRPRQVNFSISTRLCCSHRLLLSCRCRTWRALLLKLAVKFLCWPMCGKHWPKDTSLRKLLGSNLTVEWTS